MARSALPWEGAGFKNEALRTFGFSSSDANEDIFNNRDILEGRSRQLYQNAPFAGAAVDTKIVNVVGTGVVAKPNVNAKRLGITQEQADEFCEHMKWLFALWAASPDASDATGMSNFYQMQELVLKTKAICGDAFILRCWHKIATSAFGLCYKVLEGNRCRNPFGRSDSKFLKSGVELDGDGKHVAYNFTKDCEQMKYDVFGTYPTVRIPAYDQFGIKNVIQVITIDRPGQHRGVSWLAPVIPLVKNKDRYENSVLIQAILESMLTVFIKNTGSDAAPLWGGNIEGPERTTPDPTQPTEGQITSPSFGTPVAPPTPAIELGPGNVVMLGQNQEAQVAQKNAPNSNYRDYMQEVNMAIASRLGMSFEQVQKFWKGSYNAVRAAILESKKMFDLERERMIIGFCQPVYDAFLHECVMMGYVKCPGYENPLKRMLWHECSWIGDAPVMLDPLKEMSAYKMALDEQVTTREKVSLAVNGSDYYENVNDLAREDEARKAHGVQTPGAVNRSESVSMVANPNESEEEPENNE